MTRCPAGRRRRTRRPAPGSSRRAARRGSRSRTRAALRLAAEAGGALGLGGAVPAVGADEEMGHRFVPAGYEPGRTDLSQAHLRKTPQAARILPVALVTSMAELETASLDRGAARRRGDRDRDRQRRRAADAAPTGRRRLSSCSPPSARPAPTPEARRRVAAALRVAGMGVGARPPEAAPGQRLLLLEVRHELASRGAARSRASWRSSRSSPRRPRRPRSSTSATTTRADKPAGRDVDRPSGRRRAPPPTRRRRTTTSTATTATETTSATDDHDGGQAAEDGCRAPPREARARERARAAQQAPRAARRAKSASGRRRSGQGVTAAPERQRPPDLPLRRQRRRHDAVQRHPHRQRRSSGRACVRINIGLGPSTRLTVNGNPVPLDGEPDRARAHAARAGQVPAARPAALRLEQRALARRFEPEVLVGARGGRAAARRALEEARAAAGRARRRPRSCPAPRRRRRPASRGRRGRRRTSRRSRRGSRGRGGRGRGRRSRAGRARRRPRASSTTPRAAHLGVVAHALEQAVGDARRAARAARRSPRRRPRRARTSRIVRRAADDRARGLRAA